MEHTQGGLFGFPNLNLDDVIAELMATNTLPPEALERGGLFASLFQTAPEGQSITLPLGLQFPLGDLPPPLSFTPQLSQGIQRQQQLQGLPADSLVNIFRSGALGQFTGPIPEDVVNTPVPQQQPSDVAGIRNSIEQLQLQLSQAIQAGA